MATIVEHTRTGDRYILLGAGHARWATSRPHRVWQDISPVEQQGDESIVCLCDAQGTIGWAKPENLKVISVDGQTPSDALGALDG
jgi:hypothetical protein